MTNANEPTSVTAIYFDSWRQGDLATLRSVLADDVDFLGPLAQINGADLPPLATAAPTVHGSPVSSAKK